MGELVEERLRDELRLTASAVRDELYGAHRLRRAAAECRRLALGSRDRQGAARVGAEAELVAARDVRRGECELELLAHVEAAALHGQLDARALGRVHDAVAHECVGELEVVGVGGRGEWEVPAEVPGGGGGGGGGRLGRFRLAQVEEIGAVVGRELVGVQSEGLFVACVLARLLLG